MKKANSFLASNLKFLRTRKKKSQGEVAASLEITRTKLNSYENAIALNPPATDLMAFGAYFKMSIDTLLKVDLKLLGELQLRQLEAGNDIYITGTKLRVLATTVNNDNKENVEVVGVKARAGYLAGYNNPDYIASLPVFNLPFLSPNKKYRMFQADGDSMPPLTNKDYVIGEYIDDWTSIKDNQLCLIITQKEGMSFKHVFNRFKQKQSLLLRSTNPAFSDYEIQANDIREIWKFNRIISEDFVREDMPVQDLMQVVLALRSDLNRILKT